MIKGFYASASAMLAGLEQQNALAHNIANMNTPGFKQILISLDDYWDVAVLQPTAETSTDGVLTDVGIVGLGVETVPEETDFKDGPLQYTGQSLDFAIQGSGFFRVQTPNGERYTRDGRFSLDAGGSLVTVDGFFVLDENGQPVRLPPDGPVTASSDGTLFVNGEAEARLGMAAFANPGVELIRDGSNTFSAAAGPTGTEQGVVVQQYLEGANVDSADLMTKMVQIARYYEASQQLVESQDQLLGSAINTLSRLS